MILYTFEEPFIPSVSTSEKYNYILEILTDSERGEISQINELLYSFLLDEDILTKDKDELKINPGDVEGSWKWKLATLNFRSLVLEDVYGGLMHTLNNGSDNPLNKILDLHARLGTCFSMQVLNTLTNRTITAISRIPLDVDKEEANPIPWNIIHKETPFLWILIYTQVLLRNQSTKTIGDA